jgi:DAHP synthase ferredoxin-like domain
MIINMAVNATEDQIDHVVKRIQECGFQAHLSRGEERAVIGVVGKSEKHPRRKSAKLPKKWRAPEQSCCVAERSSRARLPIPSKASAKKG